jgi:hypothetical protein
MKPKYTKRNTVMKTQLIAITTATAIAFTGLASAPAQAGSGGEFARFLVGAVILGAIANEVNKNNAPARQPRAHSNRPAPHVHRQAAAVTRGKPAQCKRSAYRDHSLKVWYRAKCMNKFGWERHNNGPWHTHS